MNDKYLSNMNNIIYKSITSIIPSLNGDMYVVIDLYM